MSQCCARNRSRCVSRLVYMLVTVPAPQTWDTSNLPFSLMTAIDPPVCPAGAAKVQTPRTGAPTRICAELRLLSSSTVAFLLKDSR